MTDIAIRPDAGREEWRTIEAFPDYAVSNRGLIKRIRPDPKGRIRRGFRQGTVTSRGYRQITLWRDGVQSCAMVHRLVCIAFHGMPPTPEHHAAHNDGDSLNNLSSNLRWATAVENEYDKQAHGTVARGERQGIAKITASDVQAIRSDSRSQRAIAADYGVTQANISSLVRRKSWSHVI